MLDAFIPQVARRELASTSGDAQGVDTATEMGALVLRTRGNSINSDHLAGNCATSHQTFRHAYGIPPIGGLSRSYFIQALLEYNNSIRSDEGMDLITVSRGAMKRPR